MVAVTCALGVFAAGCGGASEHQQLSHSNGSIQGHASTDAHAAVAAAKAELAKYSKPATFKPPGPAFNVSTASGKTVWFIEINGSYPIYAAMEGGLKQALTGVHVRLRVCDGKGTQSKYNSCIRKAVAANAGAIIFDSIYPSSIAQSLAAAKKARIPVIAGNTEDPSKHKALKTDGVSAQVPAPYALGGKLVADWVIADSMANASVLVTDTTDNANSQSIVKAGELATFRAKCPNCKVYVKKTPIADWPTRLKSLTSSTLLRHPEIKYAIAEYDAMVPFMAPAIKQIGKQDSVKIPTFNATLQEMKQMANVGVISVDVGANNNYVGWAYADQALRLMTGNKPVADENVPVRVFTPANVHALTLTPKAAASGSWYGHGGYKKQYQKLWLSK
jgi:ribose transport system substrate-binding protein